MANIKKWIRLSFLGCGILAWVFFREAFTLAFDPLGLNRLDWVIPPADVAALLLGLTLFVALLRWERATIFLTEAFSELAKVTWPNKKETALSTGVVSIMLGIAALCILFFDSIWGFVAEKLLYR